MAKKRRPLKARPGYYEPISVGSLEGVLRTAVEANEIDEAALASILKQVRKLCWVPPLDPKRPFKHLAHINR